MEQNIQTPLNRYLEDFHETPKIKNEYHNTAQPLLIPIIRKSVTIQDFLVLNTLFQAQG